MANEERIPAEILKKVRRIELSTRHLVNDLFGGEYHSVFKGMGMEFDEVREYTPGDDVRSIDWNVTARMGRPFIKRFREERELTLMLVVDASASGLFGSGDRLKSEIIAEVASVLAFSAVRNQDKVGCLFFTDRVEKYIPPEKGHRHVLRIIRELLYFHPEGDGTDLGVALESIKHLLKRKAVVFLISDFMSPDFEVPLRLAARRHDLIAINIHDPRENSLPDVGLLNVHDAETGEECWLDTGNRLVRKHFAAEAQERRDSLGRIFGKYGVDEITLDVTTDTIHPLVRFFKQRMKRMSRGGLRLLLAGMLTFAGFGAEAQQTQQQQPPPTIQPAPTQSGQPGGMPGMPGQQQAPSIPITPRAQLRELPLPTLADLTGAARPRYHESTARGIIVESLLARDIMTIGERNSLTWRIVLPQGGSLIPPEWDAGTLLPLMNAEAVEAGVEPPQDELTSGDLNALAAVFAVADTIPGGASAPDTLRYRLEFTTFRPDTLQFPPQLFRYQLTGENDVREIATAPLQVECVSVLAASVDSTALRDWKAPGDLRGNWLPVIAKIALPILLALGIIIGLLIWWLRRRKLAEVPEYVIPADTEALEAFESLALEDLPARGAFHEYYFRLSRIMRHYMSRRFSLPFIDWTSEEIRQALLGSPPTLELEAALRDPLLGDLDRADIVKFAHRQPTRTECIDSMQLGKQLVKATRNPLPFEIAAREAAAREAALRESETEETAVKAITGDEVAEESGGQDGGDET
ncbi:MAG: DUF58 domain-containing protein [bacterium]|nr:DUF58 domain-containing protein [bacterium]